MNAFQPSRVAQALSILLLLVGSARGEVREIPVTEPADAGMSADKLALLAPAVKKLVYDGSIPGAIVAVARHGSVVYSRTFGEGVQPGSIVRIASMTKPITAVAVMILYDEERFRLDDPVGKHLLALKGLRVYPTRDHDVTQLAEVISGFIISLTRPFIIHSSEA